MNQFLDLVIEFDSAPPHPDHPPQPSPHHEGPQVHQLDPYPPPPPLHHKDPQQFESYLSLIHI